MEENRLISEFSFYHSLKEKRNYLINLEELHRLISSDCYQLLTRRYRQFLEEGKLAEAKAIKSNLPCAMVAGRCEGMHNDRTITHPTGLFVLDIDGLPPGMAEQLKERLKELPYVVLAFITISRGLKAIVLAQPDGWERHRAIYALIAAVVGNELGVQLDMSSDNPSRLSFVCHDPDAYFNPGAVPFDWAGLELFPDRCAQLRGQADLWRKRTAPPATGTAATQGGNANYGQHSTNQQTTAPQGYILHTIHQFFHYNPWMRGQRNNLLLALGRRLKGKHFSQAELEQAIAWVVQNYAESDCTERDIRTRLVAGFNYAQLPQMEEKATPYPHQPHKGAVEEQEKEQDSVDVEDTNEEVRKSAPYFDAERFSLLPPLLQRILTYSYTQRERDMLLVATLSTLSAALPRVEFSYFNRMHAPPLYFLAVAPPGSGKGAIALMPLLVRRIEGYLEGENRKAMAHYKERLQEWELEKRRAQKEGRVPNAELEPMEPKQRQVTMAPNTSKNQLIISLAHNQPYALLTISPELDMVTGAVNADCGGHDVVFRQAFHAEAVGSHFKVDKEPIRADAPRLALCLSGTPDQALKFLPSQENGMASRMSIYLSQAEPQFLSAAPDEKRKNLEANFGEMAQEVLANYLFLDEYATEVKFTPAQWKRHQAFFEKRLQEVVADQKGDTTALVYRGAFIAMRIATILTALRKCEAQWEMHDIYCRDEDFETALSIEDTLLHHNLLFSTMQAPPKGVAKAGSGIFRMKKVLRKMATIFTFGELMQVGQSVGVPKTSIERYLKKMIEMKLLVKEDDSYRKTGKHWPQDTP
ncbi:MAG: DUF3987 domain-containing protein [Phocaeicola sp.]